MIRPATADDAEAVARVHVLSWQGAYTHLFTAEQLSRLSVERRAEFWREHPPLVAEADGEVVGFVAVGPATDDDADGELYAIYVLPEHWGTGVGRELMAAGEARLRELAFSHPVLWVFEDNPRARGFYEAAGWTTDGQRKLMDAFGTAAPVVRYAKTL